MVISTVRRFIAAESTAGIVLALAALAALVVSNSPLAHCLAFEGLDAAYEMQVKVGVLVGSLLSALAGCAVLLSSTRRSGREPQRAAGR